MDVAVDARVTWTPATGLSWFGWHQEKKANACHWEDQFSHHFFNSEIELLQATSLYQPSIASEAEFTSQEVAVSAKGDLPIADRWAVIGRVESEPRPKEPSSSNCHNQRRARFPEATIRQHFGW